MNYQLPKRAYGELVDIVTRLYDRAANDLNLNPGQSFMYAEDETNLLRDEKDFTNNVPLYVVLAKVGLERGLTVDKTDPDFECILSEFKKAFDKFDIDSIDKNDRGRFEPDFDSVRASLDL